MPPLIGLLSPRRSAWAGALALLAIALASGNALAQGTTGTVRLRWDACWGDGGVPARSFTCDTDVGTEVLYVSVVPGVDIPNFTGAAVYIDVLSLSPTGPIPDWWQMQLGGCRSGALSASAVPPAGASHCMDPWQGKASGASVMIYPVGYAAQIRVIWALPDSFALHATDEVFITRIFIQHAKTAAADSCSGCGSAACLGVSTVLLTPARAGAIQLIYPDPNTDSDAVTWQDGATMRRFYDVGPVKSFQCLSTTAVLRPTWGGIKSLYRR